MNIFRRLIDTLTELPWIKRRRNPDRRVEWLGPPRHLSKERRSGKDRRSHTDKEKVL